MDHPSGEVLEMARQSISMERRNARRIVIQYCIVVAVGVALGLLLPSKLKPIGLFIGLGAGSIAAAFAMNGYRLRNAQHSLLGPYRKVWAVGWSRPPDGCNYALFDGLQQAGGRPDWVLRLPTVRDVQSGAGFLCGEPQPGRLLGGHALIADTGTLLAAGRIVRHDLGQKRWERRTTPKSGWVSGGPGQSPSE